MAGQPNWNFGLDLARQGAVVIMPYGMTCPGHQQAGPSSAAISEVPAAAPRTKKTAKKSGGPPGGSASSFAMPAGTLLGPNGGKLTAKRSGGPPCGPAPAPTAKKATTKATAAPKKTTAKSTAAAKKPAAKKTPAATAKAAAAAAAAAANSPAVPRTKTTARGGPACVKKAKEAKEKAKGEAKVEGEGSEPAWTAAEDAILFEDVLNSYEPNLGWIGYKLDTMSQFSRNDEAIEKRCNELVKKKLQALARAKK